MAGFAPGASDGLVLEAKVASKPKFWPWPWPHRFGLGLEALASTSNI